MTTQNHRHATLLVAIGLAATFTVAGCRSGPNPHDGAVAASLQQTIAQIVCADPATLTVWGDDPNTIGDTYDECSGPNGADVFIRVFATTGAEQLYIQRVSALDTGGEQIVIGPLWSVSTTDQTALTAALNNGGQLL